MEGKETERITGLRTGAGGVDEGQKIRFPAGKDGLLLQVTPGVRKVGVPWSSSTGHYSLKVVKRVCPRLLETIRKISYGDSHDHGSINNLGRTLSI